MATNKPPIEVKLYSSLDSVHSMHTACIHLVGSAHTACKTSIHTSKYYTPSAPKRPHKVLVGHLAASVRTACMHRAQLIINNMMQHNGCQ